jgi:lipid-A-disaccharide synthase
MARDFDLVLSIFPFEKEWYAKRVPKLRVEFVGHPMMGRSQKSEVRGQKSDSAPMVLLLPGSRLDEVRRHLPVMVEVARILKAEVQARCVMVLPNEELAAVAASMVQVKVFRELSEPEFDLDKHPYIKCLVGNLSQTLTQADLAITKSGTITMECAAFGVPSVVFYKTSWPTYAIGKQIVSVKYIAMPNLLLGEEIFPEFIQEAATAENISRAALELLRDETRRRVVKAKLAKVIASLGGPGATERAAAAIMSLLP